MKPAAVVPATTPHAPDVNPFVGAKMYVNPEYHATVEALAAKHPGEAPQLKKLAAFPTAIWMSKIADLATMPHYLDDAMAQQTAGGQPVVPVFVVYDMPGRDCAAAASAGELGPNDAGEARYQKEYIDVIAAALSAHPQLNTALIVEPDSLANLVTNLEKPNCAAAEGIYKRAIAYAIAKLSLPNAFLYIDAAHAGWLGWPRNLVKSLRRLQRGAGHGGRPGAHPRLRDRRLQLRPVQGSDRAQARSGRRPQRRARLRRGPGRRGCRRWGSPARGS